MTSLKKFSIIVATNNDNLIGTQEYGECNMPWPYLKDDMNFFRKITTATSQSNEINACIIGHNTWKTLSDAYRKNMKRYNIVITRDSQPNDKYQNIKYVPTFNEAIEYASYLENINNIFVIGGGVIYDLALRHPNLENIYLTHIQKNYIIESDRRIYFPLTHKQLNDAVEKNYIEIESENMIHDIGKNIKMNFLKYRINNNDFSSIYHEVYSLQSINLTSIPKKNIISESRIQKVSKFVMIIYMIINCIIDYLYSYFNMTKKFFESIGKILQNKCDQNSNQLVEYSVPFQENQYLNLVNKIISEGTIKKTRNGMTRSIFGYQLQYDLSLGYPLQTVKKSYPKAIFEELMWMIRGQTDVDKLQKVGVHIWDKNSTKEFLESNNLNYEAGDIGPGYGFQMRHFGAKYDNCKTDYHDQGIDQLNNCIDAIMNNPNDRRIIISLWNPVDIKKMALPPCHIIYNFGVDVYDEPNSDGKTGKLNCHLLQRSWDVLLGWNTTTAALLTYILAHHCNLDPGTLIHSISDAHLYQEHIDSGAVDKLLSRKPRQLPKLSFNTKHTNIEDYVFDDIIIEDYYPCPAIIAEMIA
ncbi:bifunctional dihydrofolate reductase-thymidylate synthase [Megavirus courdo11]|uniref:thymidylate synthase n=1 Tax=Megavirus courdo11 TaxID=1128140 RepID=K7YER7_9VIRU|nr:bifunctional dihydrofolate reductase-thymidylate synthase [Megavirus courdo11]